MKEILVEDYIRTEFYQLLTEKIKASSSDDVEQRIQRYFSVLKTISQSGIEVGIEQSAEQITLIEHTLKQVTSAVLVRDEVKVSSKMKDVVNILTSYQQELMDSVVKNMCEISALELECIKIKNLGLYLALDRTVSLMMQEL